MIDSRFHDLIAHLWRGGKYAYFWTPDDGAGQKTSYWLTVPWMDEVPKLFWDKDAYFSVNPSIIRRSEFERAGNADIAAINCLYAEFDFPTRSALDAFLAKLLTFGVKATCVVSSGGGWHVYIWLTTPFVLDTPAKQQRAADLQWAFAQFAGGDTSVNDLARVLRIPGTVNHKAKYAPNFPAVTIELWEPSAQYELSDLEPFLQPLIDARDATQAHSQAAAGGSVSLSDTDLLAVLFGSKNGVVYQELWAGNLRAANGDHSVADQMLSNGLAWLTGRDVAKMDSLFRQSGLYRKKWESKNYREGTLSKAANTAQTVYDPSQRSHIDPQAVAAAQAAVGMGAGGNGGSQIPPTGGSGPQPQPSGNSGGGGSYKPPVSPTTDDYKAALKHLGFYFRLNDLDDRIEVNGARLTDEIKARMKNRMRDLGFKRQQIADMQDAYLEEAADNRYHPIKEYLQSLTWNSDDHIRMLAGYFQDKHAPVTYDDGSRESVIYVWLKRWLVAAVGKVFAGNSVNAQNAVLVLEGDQNLGKSTFARWLCSGIPRYFIEKSIDPDSKEDERRLANKWVWEIGELGATTRKADREALKSFLTKETVTWRNPYAEEDSEKPALASFIGTVNNEGGFLQDATGTRRFMTVGLLKIDHSYIQNIDIDQVWAQAFYLYTSGEPWRLTAEETITREELNNEYKVEDPYDGWVRRFFDIDLTRAANKTPGWFCTTQQIVSELKNQGVTDNTTAISMRLATTMKGLGLEKDRYPIRTGPMGYWGLKAKP